jgi:hypothetical protein
MTYYLGGKTMKKFMCIFISLVLLFSLASTAYAKAPEAGVKHNKTNRSVQSTKQKFKLSDAPVIKYGKYKFYHT